VYKLDKPLPITAGMKFILREGNTTVGVGEIKEVPGDSDADISEGANKEQKRKKGRK